MNTAHVLSLVLVTFAFACKGDKPAPTAPTAAATVAIVATAPAAPSAAATVATDDDDDDGIAEEDFAEEADSITDNTMEKDLDSIEKDLKK